MNVVYLLARVCGPLLWPTTALVVLGSAATVYALQLIGGTLAADERVPWTTGLHFFMACIVLIVTRICSRLVLDWLAMRAISRIRYNLTRNLLKLPLERVEELGTPKIMAMIFDDIVRLGAGLSGLPGAVGNVVVLTGAFIYLGFISVLGVAALLIVLAVGIAVYRVLISRATVVQRQAREVRDELYDLTGGLVKGVKELTLNQHRQHFIFESIFDNLLLRHFQRSLSGAIYSTSGLTLSQVLYFLCLGVVVFLVPEFIDIDRGVLTKFAVVVLYLPAPIEGIANFVSTLTMAQVSIDRLNQLDVLGKDLHQRQAFPKEDQYEAVDSLALRDVRYEYRSGSDSNGFAVGPIDLTLDPGKVVFFVGGNGSGKTTLAKVLCGLYRPSSGEIRLDDQPIEAAKFGWYSQHFSAVFNDFHVFRNYPNTNAGPFGEDERRSIEDLLTRFDISQVVALREGTISTVTALSTGQKKRLALLVALLEDKPVYIFDEWAAEQDPQFRDIFYRQVLPELAGRNKIVVVVTHDDDYFETADRVVTLRYGKIESDVRKTSN